MYCCAPNALRAHHARYYEVHVRSRRPDDILRVGWAMSGFRPDPAVGYGVGDDIFSWAFDGRVIRCAGRNYACTGRRNLFLASEFRLDLYMLRLKGLFR